ncbi:hypothetical protein [Streptomyces sp. BH104]|uniref:hypothetical protein n=1 Tax=Streptomyces sp. BH104 TaxID=3410407 RepID=UPI003BB7C82A
MLRVVYEVADLDGTAKSDWREDRGLVRIRIARGARPEDFVASLNGTLLDFLETAEWYQAWDGEVVSIDSPGCPLRVTFELSRLSPAPPVEIRERKGRVTLRVSPTASGEEFVRALNPSIEEFLAGGQWFQLWHGEIVTMDSPGELAA